MSSLRSRLPSVRLAGAGVTILRADVVSGRAVDAITAGSVEDLCTSGLPPGLIVVAGVVARPIVWAATLPLETSFAPILPPSGDTASLGSDTAGRSVLVVTAFVTVGLGGSLFSPDKVGFVGGVPGDGRGSVSRRQVGVSETSVLAETVEGRSGLAVTSAMRRVGVASLSDTVGRDVSGLVTAEPRSSE